jgi:hypothetical protein
VTVGANHHISWEHQSLFRQKCVLDTHASHFKKMRKFVLCGKLTQDLALSSRFDVFIGHEVIRDKGDPIRIVDLFGPCLAESLYGYGCGNVIGKGEVNIDLNEFSRFNSVQAGVGGKNLLGNGHSHFRYLSLNV